MRLLEKLNFCKDESKKGESESLEDSYFDKEIYENPKRALNDLKSLYEHHKINFSKSDEARVLTAIYT